MRKTLPLIPLLLAGLLSMFTASVAFADQYVNGYTRTDGTYVAPHYRSSPNATVRDNYSYKGNTNPYTGNTGTNRYYNSPSSGYYRGYDSGGSNNSGLNYGSGWD